MVEDIEMDIQMLNCMDISGPDILPPLTINARPLAEMPFVEDKTIYELQKSLLPPPASWHPKLHPAMMCISPLSPPSQWKRSESMKLALSHRVFWIASLSWLW